MPPRSVVGAFTVAALVSTVVASSASAETRIAVSPAILDLSGPLGGAGWVEVNVNNDGDGPLELITSLDELKTADGLPSATEWSSVSPVEQVVEPGEMATIELALEIPDDVAPGGHYTSVSINALTPSDDLEEGSGVNGRIVVPVYIAVTGDEENPTPWGEPAIDRSALFLDTDGQYRARSELSNSGGTHVALEGAVVIEAVLDDDERDPVANIRVPAGHVLPERVRMFPALESLPLEPAATYAATFGLSEPARGRVAGEEHDLVDSIAFVATPELELVDLAACATEAGEIVTSVSIINDGTVGVSPDYSFWLEDGDGELVMLARPGVELLAWPAETTTAESMMFTPDDGEYTLVVEIAVGAEDTLGAETTIRTGEDGDVPACEMTTDSS